MMKNSQFLNNKCASETISLGEPYYIEVGRIHYEHEDKTRGKEIKLINSRVFHGWYI